MKKTACIAVVFIAAAVPAAYAAKPDSPLPAKKAVHQLDRAYICTDYGGNQVCRVDATGRIVWKYRAARPQDAWLLPNGNILLTHVRGVQEVSPEGKVVWEYRTDPKNEVHACQPLPGGRVMVAESGPCRIIEVDRAGKIVKTVPLKTTVTRAHGQMRGARKLANGHYLVGHVGEGVLREYDSEGKVVWEFKHKHAFLGVRLPNGNTLVSTGDAHRLLEVTPAGKVVWQINENDLPGCPLRFVAGFQRLANGNTLIANWGGHGHVGQQPQVIEVTPDKRIVSRLWDDKRFKTISNIFAIGEKGDVCNFGLTR